MTRRGRGAPPPTEVEIVPPIQANPLRAKVQGGLGEATRERIAKAQAAVSAMAADHESWIESTLRRLETARAGWATDPASHFLRNALIRSALDVKGLGATVGYPLMTRVASSLARLFDAPDAAPKPPDDVIDDHLSALRAIQKGKWRVTAPQVFLDAITAIETRVAATRVQRKAVSKGSATKP